MTWDVSRRRAFRDLSHDHLHEHNDNLVNDGWRLIQISASSTPEDSGTFAAVWAKDGGPPTKLVTRRSVEDFVGADYRHKDEGYRLLDFTSTFGVLGKGTSPTVLCSGIWVKDKGLTETAFMPAIPGTTTPSLDGWDPRDYEGTRDQIFAKLTSQGYRLMALEPVHDPSQTYPMSLWWKTGGPAWSWRVDLTAADYQSLVNEYSLAGHRLRRLRGYWNGSEVRYAAIWDQTDGPPWVVRNDLSDDEFDGVDKQWTDKGYRAELLDRCYDPTRSTVSYSTMWSSPTPDKSQPAYLFIEDLLTDPNLYQAWVEAIGNAQKALDAGQNAAATAYLDNFLNENGYDCTFQDVSDATDEMRDHELSYWVGVYGQTLITPSVGAASTGPSLIVTGNKLTSVSLDDHIIENFTYQKSALSWPATASQPAGSITFVEVTGTGSDPSAYIGNEFTGTLSYADSRGQVRFDGKIGDMPSGHKAPGSYKMKAVKATFQAVNRVFQSIMLGRFVVTGVKFAVTLVSALADAAEVALDAAVAAGTAVADVAVDAAAAAAPEVAEGVAAGLAAAFL